MRAFITIMLLISFGATAASAAETITYTYDARGRLVKVLHGGTAPTNNLVTTYTYDNANNRNTKVTTHT